METITDILSHSMQYDGNFNRRPLFLATSPDVMRTLVTAGSGGGNEYYAQEVLKDRIDCQALA